MKIGIMDSGLGGLLISKAIDDALPNVDMTYIGDTLRMPYGNRSGEAIYRFTTRCVDWLLQEQNCTLVIIACNTASARALRRIQQEHLPQHYPDRTRHNVLGVVIPTLETAIEHNAETIGVIGTNYTISSDIYGEELIKLSPKLKIVQQETPLLVPIIENEGMKWAPDILDHYLAPLKSQNVDSLILGCTHYSFLKTHIKNIMGPSCHIIAQDEIVPEKLKTYLNDHPEFVNAITYNNDKQFYVTDKTNSYVKTAQEIYNQNINILEAKI